MARPSMLRPLLRLSTCSMLVALAACGSSPAGSGGSGGASTGSGGSGGAGGAAIWPGTCSMAATGPMGWFENLGPGNFTTHASYVAYEALEACACMHATTDPTPGCRDICRRPDNGSIIDNFCNGAGAFSMCQMCLTSTCGMELDACLAN